jgi:hypothetical protein
MGRNGSLRRAGFGVACLAGLALAAADLELARASERGGGRWAPLYARRHVPIATVPNPLVSAEYKATPDYDYLYTPAAIEISPPPLANHRYAADFGYLLRPLPGARAAASAYRWRSCSDAVGRIDAPPALSLAARSGAFAVRDRPAVGRERGRKIDNALRPDGLLPPEADAPGRLSASLPDLRLADAMRLPAVGAERPSGSCLLIR